ncbi:hypothetical protein SCP_1100820 [Sparassis crispa]|uniref:Uncharacterized protein n=1 Tax=Sparassis crispa TaxID=139825 RepID=A0A401GZ05_9APHY|nr:hypothetical protein SCP_1100820 [Sparassis crispa]GBE87406.1 hypothetical protein SCP_1100820 [Sparassis crispa]
MLRVFLRLEPAAIIGHIATPPFHRGSDGYFAPSNGSTIARQAPEEADALGCGQTASGTERRRQT